MTEFNRRQVLMAAAAATAAASLPRLAAAQSREETLRFVHGSVWTALTAGDLTGSRASLPLSANVYDRLVTYGRKEAPGGGWEFDFTVIEPELCESYSVSDDGLTLTFKLDPAAKWHDGTPVTAQDVKWSLDRAVSAETMSKSQLASGSITSPDQIAIVDETTVTVTLPQADRLALPNLAMYLAPMINSTLAKSHATEADPWAIEWLRTNTAASGAYTVERMSPDGAQVVLARNEAWTGGPLPGFKRVIVQSVPEASTRATLLQKGDADLCLDFSPTDLEVLEAADGVKVIQTPQPSGFAALIFNTQMAPFDDPKLRKAISMALPYDRIFETAANGQGMKLYDGAWEGEPETGAFPQPMPYTVDIEAAKAMVEEAGHAGLTVPLYYTVAKAGDFDPAAALIQEALARIGITVEIQKTPDAQYAEIVTAKTAPMLLERSLALLPSPDYFFRIFLNGDSRWNFSSWANPEVAEILPKARYEADEAAYETMTRRLVALAYEETPMVMLWKPTTKAAMAEGIAGYTMWYHFGPDFRTLDPA